MQNFSHTIVSSALADLGSQLSDFGRGADQRQGGAGGAPVDRVGPRHQPGGDRAALRSQSHPHLPRVVRRADAVPELRVRQPQRGAGPDEEGEGTGVRGAQGRRADAEEEEGGAGGSGRPFGRRVQLDSIGFRLHAGFPTSLLDRTWRK